MHDNNDTTFPTEDAWTDEDNDTTDVRTITVPIPSCKDCGDEPGLLAGRCGECTGKLTREVLNKALNNND